MHDQNADNVEWDARLREGLTTMAERAPHDPDLAGTLRDRAGRGRRWTTVPLVAASVGVAVGSVWVAVAIRGQDPSPGQTSSSEAADGSYTCPASTPVAVVPAWARAGFSDRRPKMPYVLGDDGRIVAIVFGNPLNAPESADHSNKVLWVAKAGDGPLTIEARLNAADEPAVVELTAPGPSYLNLPTPGCWHLDLSWGDQIDSMSIRVQAP